MAIPSIAPYPMLTDADIPADALLWRCESQRAALLIHDMQRYFLAPFPPAVPPLSTLMTNVARITTAARAAGLPVIYTAQPGGMTPRQRGLLADVWGPGMSTDPSERQIVEELTPAPGDMVLTKWRYSAFSRSPLEELLARHQRDQLIICGVYAHVGCLMTACDAFTRDIQPFLVIDAMADFDAGYHQLAVRYAAERCARTLTSDNLIAELRRPATTVRG
ncbi:MAG TPA: isochorismatase family protein [Micromonosporaceae bacterium]|jgi:bifunctional isochorismate lyase/aryl carrier protein